MRLPAGTAVRSRSSAPSPMTTSSSSTQDEPSCASAPISIVADDQLIALDPRIGENRIRAEAGAVADRDEIIGAAGQIADEHILADLRAERAQIEAHDRRALETS